MPYIKQSDREFLNNHLVGLADCINDEGQLNYVVTMLSIRLAARKGGNYAAYNAVIGALECCKLELYRRSVGPYEDTKILENGDV